MAAEPPAKAEGLRTLESAPVTGPCTVRRDLHEALKLANQIDAHQRTVIYVSQGDLAGDAAEAVLESVHSANKKRVRIHVIAVDPTQAGESFLKRLADQNGGTYYRLAE